MTASSTIAENRQKGSKTSGRGKKLRRACAHTHTHTHTHTHKIMGYVKEVQNYWTLAKVGAI